jgi:23S rRNA (guanosine2251-2'-O)-methyltransferase
LDAILPPGSVHQGLAILVSPLAPRGLDDVLYALAAGPATAVVLDHVTDPRNVGAALRAAAAFGADFVIVTERHAPDESAALAKAASGALDSVPLVRVVNLARALETLKEEAFVCVGLDGDADLPISAVDLVGRVALVLGAEGSGLRRLTRERCDRLVRIPQGKAVESLNVASAAAIALYERARQRDR